MKPGFVLNVPRSIVIATTTATAAATTAATAALVVLIISAPATAGTGVVEVGITAEVLSAPRAHAAAPTARPTTRAAEATAARAAEATASRAAEAAAALGTTAPAATPTVLVETRGGTGEQRLVIRLVQRANETQDFINRDKTVVVVV